MDCSDFVLFPSVFGCTRYACTHHTAPARLYRQQNYFFRLRIIIRDYVGLTLHADLLFGSNLVFETALCCFNIFKLFVFMLLNNIRYLLYIPQKTYIYFHSPQNFLRPPLVDTLRPLPNITLIDKLREEYISDTFVLIDALSTSKRDVLG